MLLRIDITRIYTVHGLCMRKALDIFQGTGVIEKHIAWRKIDVSVLSSARVFDFWREGGVGVGRGEGEPATVQT